MPERQEKTAQLSPSGFPPAPRTPIGGPRGGGNEPCNNNIAHLGRYVKHLGAFAPLPILLRPAAPLSRAAPPHVCLPLTGGRRAATAAAAERRGPERALRSPEPPAGAAGRGGAGEMPPGGASARARAARRGCCMRAGTIAHDCAVHGRSSAAACLYRSTRRIRPQRPPAPIEGLERRTRRLRRGTESLQTGAPGGARTPKERPGGRSPAPTEVQDRGTRRQRRAISSGAGPVPAPTTEGIQETAAARPPLRRPSPAHSPVGGRGVAAGSQAPRARRSPPHAPHDERRGRRRGLRRKGAALAGGRSCAGRTRFVRPLRAVPAAADW